uniref:Kelch domain containing 1 n=1 Tax=Callorhinchus milii TaxID=7868 RepID=A0A4W3K6E8_CALMI|eukprot:gi/632942699/ref/XP_007886551.1/ PREDICTED: kelch domain-containing protein 1 isoform X6 [Callorhinchus milii]
MAEADATLVTEERSGRCAVLDGNHLYDWGGYIIYENHEVYLPNDEIWVYELENGTWQKHAMKGDLPPPLSRSCAACLNGIMYIFGGYDGLEYTNEMYCVNLQVKDATYIWKKLRNCQGICPTPRHELSCWVHKDRLIYFGGYGCKRISELNDSFYVNEASWEEEMFWGWNCEIHVFDPSIQIWYQPTTKGMPPRPRAAHACAVLGNKGYLFGGRILETRINDLHCLDLDSWTWSGEVAVDGIRPQGRLWHTLTPVTDDQLFLFGGLSAESQLLSDAWIYSVGANEWRQFAQCLKNRPRLWHTSCLGKEFEVMVFSGSKDDLLSYDTGHCNDVLIFQTQPYSLLRLCLNPIAKNATVLQSQLPFLPRELLDQVQKKINFWVSAGQQEKCDCIFNLKC